MWIYMSMVLPREHLLEAWKHQKKKEKQVTCLNKFESGLNNVYKDPLPQDSLGPLTHYQALWIPKRMSYASFTKLIYPFPSIPSNIFLKSILRNTT